MPRLTARQYLKTHDRLRSLWLRDARLFSELSPKDQWLLHDFFVPDRELSNLELLQYREAITKERPSLPHQAGRALERFWTTTANVAVKRVRTAKVPAGPRKRVRQEDRHFTIKPLARSEIDLPKLARAFRYVAEDQARKRRQQLASTDSDQESTTSRL